MHYYWQNAKVNMPRNQYKKVRDMIYNAGDDEKKLHGIWEKYCVTNKDVSNGLYWERENIARREKNATYLSEKNAKGLANEVKDYYNDYARSDISDMFDGFYDPMFGLNRQMGYGHDPGYFGIASAINYEKVATEAFAEMYSAYMTDNESLKKIQIHFPRTYDMFLEMLEAIK